MDDSLLSLPITHADREIAAEFAAQQPTPQKAAQVRCNTLAIKVMEQYLRLMEVPTSTANSDSWNPIVRLSANIADLEITGLGRIECRPILPNQVVCCIPREVWHDRIGYVGIRIAEDGRSGDILGFVPQVTQETILITQFQPLAVFIDYLHTQPATPVLANLSQWLEGEISAGWQWVQTLLEPNLGLAFRNDDANLASSTEGGKLINLGQDGWSVILSLRVSEVDLSRRRVLVRLAGSPPDLLPPDLDLSIVDADGNVVETLRSRSTDDYMQTELIGEVGEGLSIRIELEETDTCMIEEFII